MISNIVSQLQEQDASTAGTKCLRRYRGSGKDLGYPPLVTPTSQIVGTQAVLNVLVNGQRYRNVTKEVKDYVQGLYGKSPAPVSDEIRTLIIGDEEVITVRPADLLEPAYESMKKEAKKAGLVKKEEDILTYILYPAIAPSFLKGERSMEEIPKKQPARNLPARCPARWKSKSTAKSSRSRSFLWGEQGRGGKRCTPEDPARGIRRRHQEQYAGHGAPGTGQPGNGRKERRYPSCP